MKILHLLSNWKWTERSEPAADLALAQQNAGAEVCFVCGRNPYGLQDDKNTVGYNAQQKGLNHVVLLNMPKHLKFGQQMADVKALRELKKTFNWDIIIAHMPNAHLTAAFLGRGNKIVRFFYSPDSLRRNLRSRWLLKRHTHGAQTVTQKMAARVARKGRLPHDRVCVSPPGVDIARFNPQRPLESSIKFNTTPDNFVIGLVTRIRAARRLDIALKATAEIAAIYPHVRLMIVGRGSDGALEEVIMEPARKLDIVDKLILPGYCRDDDLAAAYRNMDILVYPTAGTDKTCRTVREAMATGTPVVAPPVAILPEVIRHGFNGFFMEANGDKLVEILTNVILHPNELRKISTNAYDFATQSFDLEALAQKTCMFYKQIVETP